MLTQAYKVIKNSISKYIKTSARVGDAPPVWKRAQIQGLKESRLTLRGDGDQDLAFSEDVLTSPVIWSRRLVS